MPKYVKAVVLALLIFAFFAAMARIDYIVHSVLYNYGLEFSYDWANNYWITYQATFTIFSIIVGMVWWLSSNKTTQDMKLSITLAFTINALSIGGFQDILYFSLWGEGLPPTSFVWWWVPWIRLAGTWNSLMQIGLVVFTSLISLFALKIATRK